MRHRCKKSPQIVKTIPSTISLFPSLATNTRSVVSLEFNFEIHGEKFMEMEMMFRILKLLLIEGKELGERWKERQFRVPY